MIPLNFDSNYQDLNTEMNLKLNTCEKIFFVVDFETIPILYDFKHCFD